MSRWWYIQGVPKVRSSNFMRYNFWSKLYFFIKFLKDVYKLPYRVHVLRSSVTGMPHLFLSHSVAVAAWSGIQNLELQISILTFFFTWRAGATSTIQTRLGSWKKFIFWAFIQTKKIIIPAPFFSKKGFFTSLQIWDELIVACRTNLRFSWTCSRLGLLTVVTATSSSFHFCI